MNLAAAAALAAVAILAVGYGVAAVALRPRSAPPTPLVMRLGDFRPTRDAPR